MNLAFLWASVTFCAQNGKIEDFLLQSAQSGIRLRNISPALGGVHAECPAWYYRRLFYLARKNRVSLHLTGKSGLFFRIRPLLHRRGIWFGMLVFLPLFFLSQQYIWSVHVPDATSEEKAFLLSTLATTCRLYVGDSVSEQRLSEAEYALLQTGNFAWVNLNFFHGRLTVEFSSLHPKPTIWTGNASSLYSKVDGSILSIRLTSGTPLVEVGQNVTKGQELIGTSRTERDSPPAYEPASGVILAQFSWSETCTVPLSETITIKSGASITDCTIHAFGHSVSLPSPPSFAFPHDNLSPQTTTLCPSLFGLSLPLSVRESTYYLQEEIALQRPKTEALSLARLSCLQKLFQSFLDASILSQDEQVRYRDNTVHYTVHYTVVANICQ